MATRCQIGLYDSTEQKLEKPTRLFYQHWDGYPSNMLPWLHESIGGARSDFNQLEKTLSMIFEVEEPDELHGDLNYFYRIDPTGVTVYRTPYPTNYVTFRPCTQEELDD